MSEGDKVLEILTDLCSALESAAVDAKRRIAEIVKVPTSALSEAPFLSLKWSKAESAKLKEYEFTTKDANSGSDNFNRCVNILKANNAAINNRFHEEGWGCSYWLYPAKPDTIYRQLLKSK